nr:MAG TPA: hypothetical protein [Caudoviricetes sp.]
MACPIRHKKKFYFALHIGISYRKKYFQSLGFQYLMYRKFSNTLLLAVFTNDHLFLSCHKTKPLNSVLLAKFL